MPLSGIAALVVITGLSAIWLIVFVGGECGNQQYVTRNGKTTKKCNYRFGKC